ncbi:MAG TPA: efflux RND transporter periplasmic adaptor subunit [Bacteroidales bacterium]|nr:efflux RND transporter periplasmic adaptor subunit [Bacteroidales bacterium]HRR15470.1 efflux RND transporter periplasmic adaptor subunit [Bacteroidales bacterium]HRT47036.1 efflux RND transporter periplasmic adaptor subunit [Bacteroidales bacterium]HRU56055.1 efflux RND transporter periplasmic adaptor subunit [Bacteroidales bacterium]
MKRFGTLIAVVISGVILVSCTSTPGETTGESKTAAPVKVTPLTRTKIAKTIDYSATIQAFEEVNVAPSSPGRIEKIYVEAGDRVNKGDNLFLMDRTQLYQLKLQLSSLEKDLWRLDTLLKAGSAKQQQYDQLKTQYEVTKTNVEFLEQNTLLKAPFQGIVTGKYYEDGEMYSGAPSMSGKPAVVTLMQINPLKVIVSLSEQYYPLIKKGMEAIITADVYKNEKFTGRVYRIAPTINAVTRSFNVEIEVPNRNEMLKPGMFVRVSLNLGEVETFVVPAFTVLMQEGTNRRYVMIAGDGVARRVDVAVGKRFDDNLEIISETLKEGDLLITEGQSRLSDGDKIEVVQ